MTGPSSHAYVSPEKCFVLGGPEMLCRREGLKPDKRKVGGMHLPTFPGCPQFETSEYFWGIPNV